MQVSLWRFMDVHVHIDKILSLRVKLSRLKGGMVKNILVVVF